MAWVSKTQNGYKCTWKEDGVRKEKSFSGEMAYTLAHRMNDEINIEDGIRKTVISKMENKKRTRNHNGYNSAKIPIIDEPGIPFTGSHVRKTNSTGYRSIAITTSIKGDTSYVVTIRDGENNICKWFGTKKYGGDKSCLKVAIKYRNEILFGIRDREEEKKKKTLGLPLFGDRSD